MDLGQDHGQLQDLSSPVLSKLQDAFAYIRSFLGDSASTVFTRSGSFDGPNQSTMFYGWDAANSRLVLSCRIMDFTFVGAMLKAKLASPPWLPQLAGNPQVEANCLRVFQAFTDPEDGSPDLKSRIQAILGDASPRRISCVAFCGAGSVITLAAAWAAVQWPTADVRCISFGAPAVGNADFAAAFKWLVGISYRVMFRRDPVPTALASVGLRHVHGAVYISGDTLRPGVQVKGQIAPMSDMADHAFTGYSGALHATCKAQSNREKSSGGPCRAQIDPGFADKLGYSMRHNSLRSEGSIVGSLSDAAESIDGQDEEPVIVSKRTGLVSYLTSGAGSLVADTFSVSKTAMASAFSRLGRFFTPTKVPPGMSAADGAACGHTDLAALQNARLANGDGFLAEGDEWMISGAPEPVVKSPFADCPESVIHTLASNGLGRASSSDARLDGESRIKVELGSEAHDSAAGPAATSAANESLITSSGQPDSSLVTAVMLDKRMASLNTNSHSVTDGLLNATRAAHTDTDRQSMLTTATKQVTNLGEAAIAVNEAEVSLAEAKANVGAEEVPGPLAPGVSLPTDVLEAAFAEGSFPEQGSSPAQKLHSAHSGHHIRQRVKEHVKAARPKLARAFSMVERDSSQVDPNDLSNLQKVLVMGKISQAAIVAGAAYRNEETFKQQTGIAKARLIKDKTHHDTKVHVGWLEGGTAIFAFRGTASKQDGLQDVKIFSRNIDYLQELYPGVKAHLGFMQQFAAVCNPNRAETNMAAVLKQLSGGQTPNRVICCGHSLGGALATLGAAWAALEYPDADIRCITFGSPRVANKVFGKAFNALVGTSLRLVHGFDPVPSLPPSLMYKHVPGVIHIKQDSLLLRQRPWHTMLRSSVMDHTMRKYSMGVYKHMPGGLEAHVAYFAVRTNVAKLCDKAAHAGKLKHHANAEEIEAAEEDSRIAAMTEAAPAKTKSLKRGHSRSQSRSSPFDWRSGELDAVATPSGAHRTKSNDNGAAAA